MTLALAALGRALGDAKHGVHEELGPNDGVWIREYRKNADPPIPVACAWCALAMQAWWDDPAKLLGIANPLDDVKQEALVASYYNWAKENGKLVTPIEAQAGDLVFYQFSGLGTWNHIEILARKIDTIHIRTIGGNTSPGVGATAEEKERDGDGVYVRDRIITRQPTAFARP